ncbi:hypothetical protein D3C80_1895640 [compost metagenome]
MTLIVSQVQPQHGPVVDPGAAGHSDLGIQREQIAPRTEIKVPAHGHIGCGVIHSVLPERRLLSARLAVEVDS